MVKVKICGITNVEDALMAISFGADALGFVFYEKSPRYVTLEDVKAITLRLPPFVTTVGVFVNESVDRIKTILSEANIDVAQLHGNESPGDCSKFKKVIKAFRIREAKDMEDTDRYDVSALLLDTYIEEGTYGGTGEAFNWNLAASLSRHKTIILAGGLTVENIVSAIKHVRPYGVDVSSGVEAVKAKKDPAKVKEFIRRAKGASGS